MILQARNSAVFANGARGDEVEILPRASPIINAYTRV